MGTYRNKRRGGSSGITVGTTTVTGGGEDRVLYERGGAVRSDANLRYDHDLHSDTGVHAVGGAPIDAAGISGGFQALYQLIGGHNGMRAFLARNAGLNGSGSGSGASTGYIWSMPGVAGFAHAILYGVDVTAKFFGVVRASKLVIRSQVETWIGTEGTQNLVLGVNGAHGTDATAARDTFTLKGDGRGIECKRALAQPYRRVTAAATVVAGEPGILADNSSGANINITLPVHGDLDDGYEFQLSTTSNCSGTNTVTLVAGAGGTLEARITAAAASTASRRIKLDKTAALWYLVGSTG